MKYHLPRFSVPMPGTSVIYWPFPPPKSPGFTPSYCCPKCGAYAVEAKPHPRLEDRGRTRKIICFGK